MFSAFNPRKPEAAKICSKVKRLSRFLRCFLPFSVAVYRPLHLSGMLIWFKGKEKEGFGDEFVRLEFTIFELLIKHFARK